MTECPLPIDWLDLIAGRSSNATRAHLDICPSCRAVVASLYGVTAGPADLTALTRLAADQRRQPSLTAPVSGHSPIAGEIWWLTADDAANRLPVLVLDVAEDEFAEPAVEVAPLWTDEDNATPSDLLLDEKDTTTGVRWRVAVRRQNVVARRLLDTPIGALTDAGHTLVGNALTGDVPAERTGVELESDFDPRLRADEWMNDVLTTAASTVEDECSDPDQASALHDSRISTGAQQSDLALHERGGAVLLFQLKTAREVAPNESHRLAAAPRSAGKSVTQASLRDDVHAVHVVARVWLDWHTDQLLLRPDAVSGLTGPVRLVLRSALLDSPVKVKVTLVVGQQVTLASGAAISERDIEALEMHLP